MRQVLKTGFAKTEELTAKVKEAVGKSFASNFTMDGGGEMQTYQLEGVDYKKSKNKSDGYYLDLGARQRTYNPKCVIGESGPRFFYF